MASTRTFCSVSVTTLARDPPRADGIGDLRDAVIRAQADDVVAGADGLVEMIEQPADRAVEPDEHVLDFVAARPEDMADAVDGRKADAEEVGLVAASELRASRSPRSAMRARYSSANGDRCQRP